ncbi:hypothetical protein [Actinocorallia aurea]
MIRHPLAAAALALPALALSWYAPALGRLGLARDHRISWVPLDARGGAVVFDADVPLADPPWQWYALLMFGAAAAVAGLLLDSGRRSPVPGLVAGLPLGAVGLAALAIPGAAHGLAGLFPAIGGSADGGLGNDSAVHAEVLLAMGVYLMLGAALCAAALARPLAARFTVPRLRGLTAVLAGLGVLFAAGALYLVSFLPRGLLILSFASVPLIAGSGVLLGLLAASDRLPRAAALTAGLPVLALGVLDVAGPPVLEPFASGLLLDTARTATESALYEAVATSGGVLTVFGGALVVAALLPRRELAVTAAG